jgi:hypothetical protein
VKETPTPIFVAVEVWLAAWPVSIEIPRWRTQKLIVKPPAYAGNNPIANGIYTNQFPEIQAELLNLHETTIP